VPELPELEICRRQLNRWGTGRTLTQVSLLEPSTLRSRPSSRPSDMDTAAARHLDQLIGRSPQPAVRHGKRVGWSWDTHALVIQLGMTGRWVRRDINSPAPRHSKLGLSFDEKQTLWMTDPRRFGCVCVIPADELAIALQGTMGPDALLEPLDGLALRTRFRGRRAIKVALLDQTTIAGIGNIQATEALFRAGVDPNTPIDAVTDEAWTRLSQAIPAQLQWTIDKSDAEEIEYASDAGATNPFLIYGRKGQDCPRCSTPINRAVLGGRSTFWCPTCQ
jgi:formamidopyrimidine-DNA glycosylase